MIKKWQNIFGFQIMNIVILYSRSQNLQCIHTCPSHLHRFVFRILKNLFNNEINNSFIYTAYLK